MREPTATWVRRCKAPGIWAAVAWAIVAGVAASALSAAKPTEPIELFRSHVAFLADEAQEGRGPGTAGLDAARDYVAKMFAEAGLKPGVGEAYTQPFNVPTGVRVIRQTLAARRGERVAAAEADKQFGALGMSGAGKVEAPAVFVGYGVKDEEHGYNSFSGANAERAKGKVAIVFRYEPQKDGVSRWSERKGDWTSASHLVNKAKWAQEAGAAALVIVNPPSQADAAMLTASGTMGGAEFNIPVVHAATAWFAEVLDAAGQAPESLARLQAEADENDDAHLELPEVTVRLELELDRTPATAHNVIGVLPGAGKLADQYVVIGAHYDHVGSGPFGARPENRGKLHPGADDNASGTAGLLMLASRYGRRVAEQHAPADRRTIIFVGFSGEEVGLIGSRHMADHFEQIHIDPAKVTLMLNLDMIGRLRDGSLEIWGADSAKGMRELIEQVLAGSELKPRLVGNGFGPSDHASFYSKKIPVLAFYTGQHEDYHRPTDTAEKVNAAGAMQVVELVDAFAQRAWSDSEQLAYAAPKQGTGGPLGSLFGRGDGANRPYMGVTLEDGEEGAVTVVAVEPDGPASKAGVMPGDVIVRLDETDIPSRAALLGALSRHKPADAVTLHVERAGQSVELPLTLGKRS